MRSDSQNDHRRICIDRCLVMKMPGQLSMREAQTCTLTAAAQAGLMQS